MAYFPAIFSPFTIGSLRLKNRVLMAAMGNNFSHPEGTVSDRAIAYYRERARGGAGLIITEACPVSLAGRHRGQSICPHDNSFLPGLRRLVHSIHAAGSRIPLPATASSPGGPKRQSTRVSQQPFSSEA